MARVLVVDDSAVDRRLAGSILEDSGASVAYAENGRLALEQIAKEMPDLVITDLQMPELDGLQLVREIKRRHHALPVILMTGHGSEEIAVQALKAGAASYVPKANLARDLIDTVHEICSIAVASRKRKWVLNCWTDTESHFVLVNEVAGIPLLIEHLQDDLSRMNICDEGALIHVGTALHEAMVNAIEHGNLELRSDLRETDYDAYRKLVHQRSREAPYWKRQIHVTARMSRNEAVFTIRDEGPGFDASTLPDPTEPANLEKVSGRGLLLIRTFMDEVHFNDEGNEITLVKRRA